MGNGKLTMDNEEGNLENKSYLKLESRPQQLILGHYGSMPFPNIGPRQEVVFDLGISAMERVVTVSGLVIQGYNGHQLLFEQRWPARILLQHSGQEHLRIEPGTGLAMRALHFMIHGYEPLTTVNITAVGQVENAESPDDSMTQAALQIPVMLWERQTDLHFPLRGSWWAIQGADWSDQHKLEVFSQTYAMDFVKLGADNHFFQNSGTALEEHYSWDPGVLPDPLMFRDDNRRILGNAVAISHANGEFSYYAHLQQASLQVNEGEMIRRGALLGRVGNSGHSPGPHLHFHLMQGPNLFIDQGLPAKFSHFSAGGQYFEQPTVIPTRMIVDGG